MRFGEFFKIFRQSPATFESHENPMRPESNDVLQLAVERGELDRFLVGEPYYFFETKDDNNDPQNVVVAFDLLFMPYFRRDGHAFSTLFAKSLLALINNYPDHNRAIYMAQRWIWYYRYCMFKKHENPDGMYAAVPEIDLSVAAEALKLQIQLNKAELISDNRWAGAEWNSESGLWEPLIRTAIHIRDHLGGPDFVPTNI